MLAQNTQKSQAFTSYIQNFVNLQNDHSTGQQNGVFDMMQFAQTQQQFLQPQVMQFVMPQGQVIPPQVLAQMPMPGQFV